MLQEISFNFWYRDIVPSKIIERTTFQDETFVQIEIKQFIERFCDLPRILNIETFMNFILRAR